MPQDRAGLPAQKSVVSETVFAPARTGVRRALRRGAAQTYRIIRTNEVDPKDDPVAKSAVRAFGARRAAGDTFQGTARKKAKISLSTASVEVFDDLKDLIETLPSKTKMKKHKPKITKDAKSGRVAAEERNIKLTAFLYAASREDDNDYHLIVGREPTLEPHMYMTIEVSGLPPGSAKSFAKLKAARTSYKAFFSGRLPDETYDFYDPPIPVEITGSLFFDISHATGQGVGPKSLRKDIPTVWEIHPISAIDFEPG